MTNALVKAQGNWSEMLAKADTLVRSGFLPKAIDSKEKAVAIWMMGDALGLHHMIAFQMIHIIAGKPSVAPELMLALCRRTGQLESFEYKDTGDTAVVKIKRRGDPMHTEQFSMEDAAKLTTSEWVNPPNGGKGYKKTIPLSEKGNWKEQPRVMRKWRAVSAACRLIFPDAVWGIASYTPDELGADVKYSDDGNVIDIEVVDAPKLPANNREPIGDVDDLTMDEIAEDAAYDEAPAHWSLTDTLLDAKVQKEYSMSRLEAEELMGRVYAEFETRGEAGAAVKAAVEAKLANDKPATPKSKASAAKKPAEAKKDEPVEETWYKHDSRTIDIWTNANFGRAAGQVLRDIKAKSWDDFKTIYEATAKIKETAAAELWDIRCEKATYVAKGSEIHFKTPIGELVSWSRKALIDAVQFAGQDNWKDVAEWDEGQHILPEPVYLVLGKSQNEKTLVIKEIRNASIPNF